MYDRFDEADVAADYLQLLRRGSVMRRLAPSEHEGWRRAVRTKARADDLRIRTWSRMTVPAEVWAVLPDWSLTTDERAKLAQRLAWLRED